MKCAIAESAERIRVDVTPDRLPADRTELETDVLSVKIDINFAQLERRVSDALALLATGQPVPGRARSEIPNVAAETIAAHRDWATRKAGDFARAHVLARATGTAAALVDAVLTQVLDAIVSRARAESVRFDVPRKVLKQYWDADRLAAPRRGGNVPIDDDAVLAAYNVKIAAKLGKVRAYRSEAVRELAAEWGISEKAVESRIRAAQRRKRIKA